MVHSSQKDVYVIYILMRIHIPLKIYTLIRIYILMRMYIYTDPKFILNE